MRNFLSIKKPLVLLIASLLILGVTSCFNDDYNDGLYNRIYPNALVTVKPTADDAFFLQLDDSTTLLPVNIKSSPFGSKEVRALVNLYAVDKPSGEYDQAVFVNWIDSILTKPIAEDLGVKNDSVYGTDRIDIIRDWVNIVEDGYLTLRFRIPRGYGNTVHFINLLQSTDPETPYELEFRHNAYGDLEGEWGFGLVAFNLDSLPDTKGETVKLKLKWKSYNGGDKTLVFDYCTGKSIPGEPELAAIRNQLNLK